MSQQNSEFNPTHVLIVTGDQAAGIRATNAAIDAALDHADTVDIWLSEDQLADDHPDLVASLRDAFARVNDERFRGDVDDVRHSLSELLSMTSFHRFVSLTRLDASRDGQRLLTYVPDHRTFKIDESVSPDLDTAIRSSIESESAALLPAGTLADWYADGQHYELSPPNLCLEGEGCHKLTNITSVDLDDERREIRLEWETGSDLTIAKIINKIGPTKPRQLQFDSAERYEAVARVFEALSTELDW
ncbi:MULTISPECIES: hypothetical protein [unclassified Natrinema]|uniref:hypothetical protein n=1 Tax=unclassified Natrinema TaxID=2622230 RepID=UPI00026D460E|nr:MULTISPECIES: hypothetical protein [unclassified Natrinema]AFO56223.1 hypothetical protein NJ7G_0976 [Natrinema sp. J7-2]